MAALLGTSFVSLPVAGAQAPRVAIWCEPAALDGPVADALREGGGLDLVAPEQVRGALSFLPAEGPTLEALRAALNVANVLRVEARPADGSSGAQAYRVVRWDGASETVAFGTSPPTSIATAIASTARELLGLVPSPTARADGVAAPPPAPPPAVTPPHGDAAASAPSSSTSDALGPPTPPPAGVATGTSTLAVTNDLDREVCSIVAASPGQQPLVIQERLGPGQRREAPVAPGSWLVRVTPCSGAATGAQRVAVPPGQVVEVGAGEPAPAAAATVSSSGPEPATPPSSEATTEDAPAEAPAPRSFRVVGSIGLAAQVFSVTDGDAYGAIAGIARVAGAWLFFGDGWGLGAAGFLTTQTVLDQPPIGFVGGAFVGIANREAIVGLGVMNFTEDHFGAILGGDLTLFDIAGFLGLSIGAVVGVTELTTGIVFAQLSVGINAHY